MGIAGVVATALASGTLTTGGGVTTGHGPDLTGVIALADCEFPATVAGVISVVESGGVGVGVDEASRAFCDARIEAPSLVKPDFGLAVLGGVSRSDFTAGAFESALSVVVADDFGSAAEETDLEKIRSNADCAAGFLGLAVRL